MDETKNRNEDNSQKEIASEIKIETGYPQKDANEESDNRKANVEFAYKITLNGVEVDELPAIFDKVKVVAETADLENLNIAIVLSTEEI